MAAQQLDDIGIEQVKEAVESLKIGALPLPKVFKNPKGLLPPSALPIEKVVGGKNLAHAFDVIWEHGLGAGFDQDFVDNTYEAGAGEWDKLPAPFCPKGPLPRGTSMQIVKVPIGPGGDNKFFFIKHFHFQ